MAPPQDRFEGREGLVAEGPPGKNQRALQRQLLRLDDWRQPPAVTAAAPGVAARELCLAALAAAAAAAAVAPDAAVVDAVIAVGVAEPVSSAFAAAPAAASLPLLLLLLGQLGTLRFRRPACSGV
ncbi:hypothetical protein Efla_002529 [Eimeria flavescens]